MVQTLSITKTFNGVPFFVFVQVILDLLVPLVQPELLVHKVQRELQDRLAHLVQQEEPVSLDLKEELVALE